MRSTLLALAFGLSLPLVPATALGATGGTGNTPGHEVAPARPLAAPSAVKDDRAPREWTFGTGKPTTTVVFMHGLGGSPDYRSLLKELFPRKAGEGAVKVIAPWMRPEDGPHTMTDQLERARAVIDAQPGPVILMGHSFGGKAALNLAREYSREKVPAVVALAPSVNMLYADWKDLTGERGLPSEEVIEKRLPEIRRDLETKLASLPRDDDHYDARSKLREKLGKIPLMQDLAKNDEPGVESSVRTPTLVIHGDDDHAVSIYYARRFAETNPKSVQLVEVPKGRHGFEPEDTPAMAKEISAFLKAPAVGEPRVLKVAPRREKEPFPSEPKDDPGAFRRLLSRVWQ